MIDPQLRNRSVLITGANNPLGIGAATALAFAEVGARPFLHYHRAPAGQERSPAVAGVSEAEPSEALLRAQQEKNCDAVIVRIHALGVAAASYEADFNDLASVERVFDAAEEACGPIEILINNAAAWSADTFVPAEQPGRNPFLELWTDAALPIAEATLQQFAVNTFAPALLMREFARRHVARSASWGRIVNISTEGAECFPGEASYGASKNALESYSRSAALELGQFGITVNVLSLGPIQTGWITPALEQPLVAATPLGRLGTPRDVAM